LDSAAALRLRLTPDDRIADQQLRPHAEMTAASLGHRRCRPKAATVSIVSEAGHAASGRRRIGRVPPFQYRATKEIRVQVLNVQANITKSSPQREEGCAEPHANVV
jgi:hypothetical protein